jgi:hypothetical protein
MEIRIITIGMTIKIGLTIKNFPLSCNSDPQSCRQTTSPRKHNRYVHKPTAHRVLSAQATVSKTPQMN